jgi:hypothetical protein
MKWILSEESISLQKSATQGKNVEIPSKYGLPFHQDNARLYIAGVFKVFLQWQNDH